MSASSPCPKLVITVTSLSHKISSYNTHCIPPPNFFLKYIIISGQIHENISHHIYKPAASSDCQQPSTEAHSPSLSVLRTTLCFKPNCLRTSNCLNILWSICQKASIPTGQENYLKWAPKAFLRPFFMFLTESLEKSLLSLFKNSQQYPTIN